jgi:hypothetical protein
MTLCLADFSNPSSNVRELQSGKTKRDAIAEAVRDHCSSLKLAHVQAEACVDNAIAIYRNGASAAAAVECGRKTADSIADKMRAIRTRLGTRDDLPPAA